MGSKSCSAPAPDPRLIEGQLKSMGIQDDAIQQIMANSTSMLPLQREQMQFGLDTSRTAYNQSQEDRVYALGQRGKLTGMQNQMADQAASFNTEDKRNELAGQAMGDVNQGFSNAREQSARGMARMGVNPNSGRALAMNNQMDIAQASSLAGAANMARTAARAEGYKLQDRASNALSGFQERNTDWRTPLRQFVQELCEGDDQSRFSPPNKRMMPLGIVLPSHFSEATGELIVACDTSGSMHGLYPTVFGEIARICKEAVPAKMRVIWWGDHIEGEQVFEPKDYDKIKDLFRPGHADYTYQQKYGFRDYRGGGRSSARLTAPMVAAGAVAKKWLKEKLGTTFVGCMTQIGDVPIGFESWDHVPNNPFFAPVADVSALEDYMNALRKSGDSCGARLRVVAQGVPVGLGQPLFDKIDADIAFAMMGINAVKGVEIGAGFASVAQRGTVHGDALTPQGFASNHSGGVLGGILGGAAPVAVSTLQRGARVLQAPRLREQGGHAQQRSVAGDDEVGAGDPAAIERLQLRGGHR